MESPERGFVPETEELKNMIKRRDMLIIENRQADVKDSDDRVLIDKLQQEIAKVREAEEENDDSIPEVALVIPTDDEDSERFKEHVNDRVAELKKEYEQADSEDKKRLHQEISLLRDLDKFSSDVIDGDTLFRASKSINFAPEENKKMMRQVLLSIENCVDEFDYDITDENQETTTWRIAQKIKSFYDGKSWLDASSSTERDKLKSENLTIKASKEYGKEPLNKLDDYKSIIIEEVLSSTAPMVNVNNLTSALRKKGKLRPSLFIRAFREVKDVLES